MKRMGTVMLVAGCAALTFSAGIAAAAPAEAEGQAEEAQAIEPETTPAEPAAPETTPAEPVAPSVTTPAAPSTSYVAPDQNTMIVTQAPAQQSYLDRVGLGVMLGGGVTDFTNSGARGPTRIGGAWDVRAVVGARMPIGLEVAYVGSARDVNSAGLGDNSALVHNGAEGVLRLNLVLSPMRQVIIPFAFGGIGWLHQNVTNSNDFAVPGLRNNDDAMTVPVGGGVAANYKGGYADARFTYRPAFFADSGSRLDTWTAGGNIGFVF